MRLQAMRNGFRKAKLKDLVLFQRGFDITKAHQEPGSYPVISSSGIQSYHNEFMVKGPGVVIGRKGTLGTIHYSEGDFWPHDTTLWSKYLKENHPKFVYYFLHTLNLETFNAGAANPTLNRNHIHDLDIVIPQISIQRRISDTLSAYDDLIENNLKRIALLEESARLLYREWFVRLRFPGYEHTRIVDGVPEGWRKTSLGNVSSINGVTLPNSYHGEIEYVDISSVTPGSINQTTLYDFADAPSRARRVVEHLDIIWSCVRPNRKSYALIWSPPNNLIISTGFAVITPSNAPASYLYFATTTDDFVGYLENRARGTSYPAVTSKDFEEATVIIPTHSLMLAFDEQVMPVFSQIHNLKEQNRKLKQARDLLLPRLMNGELEV